MAIAGTTIPLDSTEGMDKITTTEKITTPYFSNGETDLTSANIISSSLSDANENYFFGISHTDTATTEEFNVTFGSLNGYGAVVGTNKKSRTEAIYKQFASILLAPTEVTGGFIMSSAGSSGAISTGKDSEIFVLSAKRSNMKDRLNKGNRTIVLSGSNSTAAGVAGSGTISLTDDSVNDTPTATPVGDRYNIVSGSDGTIVNPATTKTYGWFYPNHGLLVFSATELSASIPGSTVSSSAAVIFQGREAKGAAAKANPLRGHAGFHTNPVTNQDSNNALRFANCLRADGAKLKFRDEEDQISKQFFCRFPAGGMNFSNNPTFVSGSDNELRQKTMWDNPTVYISQVQLYDSAHNLVAVGSLSTPLKKNFSSEATIKVKLTY